MIIVFMIVFVLSVLFSNSSGYPLRTFLTILPSFFPFLYYLSDFCKTEKNKSKYVFDENNSISFKTRRNRKINLTEFYDLVYEYQNDCLTAGIKYNKTYYEDRDLKPTENLLFTITLFPLTSYEQKIN